jgi:hypothetical protein
MLFAKIAKRMERPELWAAIAFSVLFFTVDMGLCCLPPLNQKAIQGWGTKVLLILEQRLL